MSVIKVKVLTGVSAALLMSGMEVAMAAPLPDGVLLEIATGTNPLPDGECTIGSCFGIEASPNFWIWTNISAGNDGGIVVGKNQLSGGQEIEPSFTNTTPGDLTAAFSFFGNYGTFAADQALNVYSDTSNNGETVINQLYWAWNGNSVPLGGGTVNAYSIEQDGMGNIYYNLDYSTIVPTGDPSGFGDVPFRFLFRSAFTIPPDGNTAPVVDDVNITGESGVRLNWVPSFTGDVGDVHTCAIATNGSNGNATVNADCSAGTYTSGSGFVGLDSFTYSVTDQFNLSSEGTVFADVTPAIINLCLNTIPYKQVTTFGGGQGAAVNGTLVTRFTGHITTESGLTSGGKNTVKICPGSSVQFAATSGIGSASCLVNGVSSGSTGSLNVGDKLICTNKPEGADVDRFSVKSGL